MEKLVFTAVTFVLSMGLSAQNKVLTIQYEVFFNTARPNIQKANLYISEKENKSIYIIINKVDAQTKTEQKDENHIDFTFRSKKARYNYFDIKKDSLFSTEALFGNDYLIAEKTPIIKWELIDETKTIGTNKVHKAVCQFRGSKYTAWYSLDYPLQFGPWKLRGLPGIIFEVSDESKKVNWTLKSIKYESKPNDLFSIDVTGLKKITIQEYVEVRYNNKEFAEKLNANLPRGTIITKSNIPRNGLETKFEWEE